ncbi:MAG: hypothetical protein MUF30_06065, partial [Burkholderiales bacterium]|nr:hypothetical protein [Burkholderiales bacterium]
MAASGSTPHSAPTGPVVPSLLPRSPIAKLVWAGIAILGAACISTIASHRGESINALWFVAAAICTYLIGFRFYSAWICARVLVLDETRATPAERFNNGRDYVPTNKWVAFGHHFAAIAGPGPLIGPTLAMQFGYLPGTLWILAGSVLGGCVQDMVTMFCSTRRDGRSLGQMAKDELGPVGGWAALIGSLMIIVILIAVLGLVIVKAMKHSPWATATVLGTIPVAMLIGIYMRGIRPGKVLEGSVIGIVLLLGCVWGGGAINGASPEIRSLFDWDDMTCAWFVMIYGFSAAALPVWLLLAPRDYLSTFLKLGVVFMLAASIMALRPDVQMPPLTQFVDGTGPRLMFPVLPAGACSTVRVALAVVLEPACPVSVTGVKLTAARLAPPTVYVTGTSMVSGSPPTAPGPAVTFACVIVYATVAVYVPGASVLGFAVTVTLPVVPGLYPPTSVEGLVSQPVGCPLPYVIVDGTGPRLM